MKHYHKVLLLPIIFIIAGYCSAQTPGFQIEGAGFGSQQRITDTVSGNSLVLQGGSGMNMKVTGFNYKTHTAQPLYLSVDGANTLLNPSGGRVGIGTISPTAGFSLDVAGRVRSHGDSPQFDVHTTSNVVNSWARLYMRSNSQSWFIGTSQSFNGNQLYIGDGTNNQFRFSIQPAGGPIWMLGPVGINTSSTTGYALAVNGNIRSKEVIVESNWADYVFDENYSLLPLEEVEKFIREHKHLPNIPSSVEVEEKGLVLGDMQKKMMEKIEELTLHLIQMKKELDALKKD